MRLYDYNEGEIFYNGKNIRSLSLDKYRKGFSTIFQDYKLFAFTVENNVSMTNDSDESLVREALSTAGIGEKIESLEAGIKTYVTSEYENGVDFSGVKGKNRHCTKLLQKNKIIILDEPSAALDALSEKSCIKIYLIKRMILLFLYHIVCLRQLIAKRSLCLIKERLLSMERMKNYYLPMVYIVICLRFSRKDTLMALKL